MCPMGFALAIDDALPECAGVVVGCADPIEGFGQEDFGIVFARREMKLSVGGVERIDVGGVDKCLFRIKACADQLLLAGVE